MAFHGDSIYWVEVEKIVENPYQPRREFDAAKLQELAESVRMYGILQPLTVTRKEIQREDGTFFTQYELIAGERRLRASRLAGVAQVPVIIRDGEETEQEKLELAIIENLQREDLNAVDRALAFRQLADAFGLSHTQVAKKVGRSREYISNSIRILSLPEQILNALRVGDITEGHARTLLMLAEKPEEQDVVFREIMLKKLSVRETERISRRIATDKLRKREGNDFDDEIIEMEKRFTETLGTRVQIQKTDFGGRLTIDYFSVDDLETMLERMRDEEREREAQVVAERAATISASTPLSVSSTARPAQSAPEAAADTPPPSQDVEPATADHAAEATPRGAGEAAEGDALAARAAAVVADATDHAAQTQGSTTRATTDTHKPAPATPSPATADSLEEAVTMPRAAEVDAPTSELTPKPPVSAADIRTDEPDKRDARDARSGAAPVSQESASSAMSARSDSEPTPAAPTNDLARALQRALGGVGVSVPGGVGAATVSPAVEASADTATNHEPTAANEASSGSSESRPTESMHPDPAVAERHVPEPNTVGDTPEESIPVHTPESTTLATPRAVTNEVEVAAQNENERQRSEAPATTEVTSPDDRAEESPTPSPTPSSESPEEEDDLYSIRNFSI